MAVKDTAGAPATGADIQEQQIQPVEAPSGTPPASPATGRILSVDALRGFDMFWIIGADSIVRSLGELRNKGIVGVLGTQLEHVEWEGFHFYDLIFPMFVFLVGVSAVFSLDKIVATEGKGKAHVRVFRRFALLYFVGFLYYGGLSHVWPDMRLVGVLQRIAIGYFFASLLYLNFRLRGLVIACVAILIGYWALFSFVPVPASPELNAINPEWGHAGISTQPGNNWANYIDFYYLIGRRHDTNWDPEGLLSSIPAVATALLGVFAGLLLKDKRIVGAKKSWILIGAGVLMVLLGTLWGLQFPIVKKLWSSSYVLVAGGYSSILLGLFYLIVDVWQFRKWTTPFVWIGANALTAYLASRFIDFDKIAEIFVGGHIKTAAGPFGEMLVTAVAIGLLLLLLRFLYKKKIFIRL